MGTPKSTLHFGIGIRLVPRPHTDRGLVWLTDDVNVETVGASKCVVNSAQILRLNSSKDI